MTNAEKYNLTEEQSDKISDEFAEWHQDNSDVQGYGEALYRFLQAKVKPTLTEDEKVILSNALESGADAIFRNDGGIYFHTKPGTKGIFGNIFQFIKPRRRI